MSASGAASTPGLHWSELAEMSTAAMRTYLAAREPHSHNSEFVGPREEFLLDCGWGSHGEKGH